jgi:hypothetical protein
MAKSFKNTSKTAIRALKNRTIEPHHPETIEALRACKGGPMRDRRERRPSEETRIAIRESEEDSE